MAALRSSSKSTTFFAESSESAISTIPTAPCTIFSLGGDDGVGLLAAQHRLGYLGRVGQMRETRVVDHDAGLLQAHGQFLLEGGGHFLDVAAERDLVVLRAGHLVVGVGGGHMAQRSLALRVHVGVVVVHVEERLRRVLHAPHNDVGDLDGIATLVVHLQMLAIVRAGAQRHLRGDGHVLAAFRVDRRASRPGKKGIRPMEALVADRALVVAEQDENARLIRLDGEEAHEQQQRHHAHADDPHHQQHDAQRLRGSGDGHLVGRHHHGASDDGRDGHGGRDGGQQQHRPAAPCVDGPFDACRSLGPGHFANRRDGSSLNGMPIESPAIDRPC